MSVDENREITRSAFEALMAYGQAPLDHLLAPDCILHQCGWLQPIRGAETIKHLRGSQQFVSELHVRIDTMVAEGDTVAIHWHTSGLYADVEDQARVGQPVSFMSMSFLRLEAGKIQDIWNIQDRSTLWAELGSEERPLDMLWLFTLSIAFTAKLLVPTDAVSILDPLAIGPEQEDRDNRQIFLRNAHAVVDRS